MFKKTALIAGIGLAISVGAQADYRFEAQGAAGRTNIDIGRDDGDVDTFAIDGSFFLDSVDTGKGPLSEAAFLDHASSISAAYVYTDLDDIVEDQDGDEYGISGRYVLGLDSIPLIFEGSYSRTEPKFADIDTYSLGFGAYLTDTTTVVLTFANTDIDEVGDTDSYNLAARHLWELPNDGAIVLEGNYGVVDVEDDDDIDAFDLAGTWYVNKSLGFGTGYGRFDNFGVEADEYSVHGEWFVTEQIGLSLEYAYTEIDDTDVESDSVELGARVRF